MAGVGTVVDAGSNLDYPPDLYRFERVAEYVQDLDAIDQRHVEAFRERGYLAVRHAFRPDQVEAALGALFDLTVRADSEHFPGLLLQYESWARDRVDEIPRDARQDHIRKLMHFTAHDGRLKQIAGDNRLGAVLRALVGADDIVM
ncbi:MAG: hypothetical protein J2P43_09655, partial [Candidatus Dormibacteraeota bacterium]|nr:hypothetical protein [Candidatus Dormibacteraeota bacterium]